jgi:hypothetical protein
MLVAVQLPAQCQFLTIQGFGFGQTSCRPMTLGSAHELARLPELRRHSGEVARVRAALARGEALPDRELPRITRAASIRYARLPLSYGTTITSIFRLRFNPWLELPDSWRMSGEASRTSGR